jgi:hypothetical protein
MRQIAFFENFLKNSKNEITVIKTSLEVRNTVSHIDTVVEILGNLIMTIL